MKTSSSSSETIKKRDWIDLINESVHTSDDIDIGDIDAVSRDFVVVKRGFVDMHYYYIPITKVEGWDGNILWLNITEEEVVTKYERDTIPGYRVLDRLSNHLLLILYLCFMNDSYQTKTVNPSLLCLSSSSLC